MIAFNELSWIGKRSSLRIQESERTIRIEWRFARNLITTRKLNGDGVEVIEQLLRR